MKEFDADELAKFNGENGNPTYFAYDGKVYDVSESKLWRKGQPADRWSNLHRIDAGSCAALYARAYFHSHRIPCRHKQSKSGCRSHR